MKRLIWLGFALVAATAARAEDGVVIAPTPDWVAPIDEPPPPAEMAGLEVRLLDYQTRFDAAGAHEYGHQIYRLSSEAALQAGGTIAVNWQPAFGRALIHKVVIRRGAERIDVLKNGATFNIIRREAALEKLQLNGVLTAVLQVPDLRVGDEVELSFTIERHNAALGGHDEVEDFVRSSSSIDRLYMRYSWPKGRPMRWRAGAKLAPASREEKDGFAAVVISGLNVKPPQVPAGAPTRYLDEAAAQVSDFADWREIATTVAPLFAKASQLSPASPVQAEIDRIAAASPEPAVRAARALELVQSQVRYFARIDGLGGFVPENADAVWQARSGDCKGKTVLLLALLRGLGVEAQPALVSTTRGDGLDKALPMAARFDHVLVRATVGGKVYWLDGTRSGDHSLDQLAAPPFMWALPLGPQARQLEALLNVEPKAALAEWRLDLDAREGLEKPAKARGEVIFRGDGAVAFRAAASLADKTALDQGLRAFWKERHDWVVIDKVSYEENPTNGEVRLGFTGTGKMDWNLDGESPAYRYEANKARMGVDIAPKRDAEVANLAPVVVAPRYEVVRQTIVLPDGGKGFYLQGEAIDQTIGGVRYTRTLSLNGDRFDLTASTRSAEGELSYAEAKAADRQSDLLFDKQVFIHMPQAQSRQARAASSGAAPNAAVDVRQALATPLQLAQDGKFAEALAALEKLKPDQELKGQAAGLRGFLLLRLGRKEEAYGAFDEALSIDRTNAMALSGKTVQLLEQNRAEDALILADRLVLVASDQAMAYEARGSVRQALGNLKGALADWRIALDKHATEEQLYFGYATALQATGDLPKALATADDYVTQWPRSAQAHALRANLLLLAGRREEAVAEITRSLQIEPNDAAYRLRVKYGLSGDDRATLADMLAAIRLAPEQALPENALRRVIRLPGARAQLEAAYDSVKLADAERAKAAAMARAMIADAAGEPDQLLASIDADLAAHPKDATRLNNACWMRATRGVQLEKALTDCNAAIALSSVPAFLDSRALVQLRLKAYPAAISDYDAALRADSRISTSLFGRGLARLRSGDRAGSQADFEAARKLAPEIDSFFADMGMKP